MWQCTKLLRVYPELKICIGGFLKKNGDVTFSENGYKHHSI